MPVSSIQQYQYLLGRHLQKEGQYLEVKMSDFHAEMARGDYVIVQPILRWDNQSPVTSQPVLYDGTTMEVTRRTISSEPQHRNQYQFSLSTDKLSNRRNGRQMLYLKNLPNYTFNF